MINNAGAIEPEFNINNECKNAKRVKITVALLGINKGIWLLKD